MYNFIQTEGHGRPIKAWTKGVPVEPDAMKQLANVAGLPFIHKHVAVMPDVHYGKGATVGSVIPTVGAIIPAAVGVDIGCGMAAVQTSLTSHDLPDNLSRLRSLIEEKIPVGRADHGDNITDGVALIWKSRFRNRYEYMRDKYPAIKMNRSPVSQIGTLGGGNHFIELCLDEEDRVWVMLHSGSRGIGNKIGNYFISKAREEMERHFIHLPDRDLAYLVEGSSLFTEYVSCVGWAQEYAKYNRDVMMALVLSTLETEFKDFLAIAEAINCHHNYVEREHHFGQNVWLTRKGAVRARDGDLGIIPGSMGTRSYIVRGKGNPESFHSCSHGAGRVMSRTEAKRRFTVEDHIRATEGVECRKDEGVIDETPAAYKDIDAVMAAQSDLVEVVHTLRQVLCVKG